MGLFDKVKNMFTEEVEDDDVKVEKIQSNVKKVSIESPSVNKQDEESEKRLRNFGELNEIARKKDEEKTKKPVFFTDSDFEDLLSKPKPVEKSVYVENKTSNYNLNKNETEKKIFKPTPIISPVYGILDKNYHKEDIVSKDEVKKNVDPSQVSIDSVRNKAYGTLEEELESTLFGQNSVLFNNKINEEKDEDDFFKELEKEAQPNVDENLKEEKTTIDKLEDITLDIQDEIDSILNKKQKKDNTKNEVDGNLNEEDLFKLIDSMYEGEDK